MLLTFDLTLINASFNLYEININKMVNNERAACSTNGKKYITTLKNHCSLLASVHSSFFRANVFL